MTLAPSSVPVATLRDTLLPALNQIILGKELTLKLAATCLLANGHLLLEDLPGMGKTTLSHALAKVFGLSYRRIQFTSDLLPADILGASVYHPEQQHFRFHPGPIFSQVFLADELNRATPKAQSALLEAMEEYQVSIEGESWPLPQPFFVIATQNPQHHAGTYPLPESQLDRFLMRLSLGYPDPAAERRLLRGDSGREALHSLQPVLSAEQLQLLQRDVQHVSVSEGLLDYVQRLVGYTRQHEQIELGLSPRAAQALLRAARSWALLSGRDYVLPDDVQAVFVAVAGHRLHGTGDQPGAHLARLCLQQVQVVA